MKKFLCLFLTVGIMLSMVTMPTVMADDLTVISWNADTSSITFDFSGAITVTDVTTRNSCISITKGINTITDFTSTLANNSKTLIIKPTDGLTKDLIYSVTLSTGIGLTAAYTKTFMLNELFSDDFSTDGISTKWKNVGAAVYDSITNKMKIESTSASAVNGLCPNLTTTITDQWTDYTWETDVTFNDSPISGMDYIFIGRSDGTASYSAGNKYQFRIAASGIYNLRKVVSGTTTTVSSTPLSTYNFTTGTTYHLKYVFKGSNIKAFIGDTLIYDITDTSMSAGTIGLRSGGSAHLLIDNVAITKVVE